MILDFNFLIKYLILNIFIMFLGISIDVISTYFSIKEYKKSNKKSVKKLYFLINMGEKLTSISFELLKFIPIIILLILL